MQTALTLTSRRALIIGTLIGTLASVGLWGHALAADKIPVVASFSILGDWVSVVGSDRVAVTTLVGPNADAHTFTPKPSDAKSITQAKLLVLNGLEFESWAQKIAKSAGYKGEIVVASQGIKALQVKAEKGHAHGKGHAHTEADPHAWQNPSNAMVYVRNIAQGLTKVDPAGASIYQANADKYMAELQTLDTWAKAQLQAIPADKRKVITSHDAFGYFAQYFGVKFLAPQGMNTDTEPSAKEVAKFITQLKREKIKAVFVETISNPKLLAQLSKDAGVTVGASLYSDALSAPGQPGATYLQMMRHNVAELAKGMQLN